MTSVAKKILKKYIDIAHKLGKWPTRADLLSYGISRDMVRYHFGNLNNLKDKAGRQDKTLKKLNIYTDSLLEDQKKSIQGHKVFVVTTAVGGAPVHKKFYESLKKYCAVNKAKLLVIPSNYQLFDLDPTISKDPDVLIVFRPLHLNSNVTVHPIKIDPKQIDPVVGLEAIAKQDKTIIVGSPKQRRRHIANASDFTAVIQSTGAVTKPNYMPHDGVPKRRDTLAMTHHVMGAVVVEVQDDKYFHFRNIEMSPDGSFVDLCVRYNPNSIDTETPSVAVLGDYHVTETDPEVERATHDLLTMSTPQYVVFHDFFSGVSINHHEAHNYVLLARRANYGQLSLEEEIKENVKVIKQYLSKYPSSTKLVFVRSNHDEFLHRYLARGDFAPNNRQLSLELAIVAIQGEDPLVYAYKKYGISEKEIKRIMFLKRDEPFVVAGNYLSAHGDIGTNGSRNPGAKGMFRAYGKCIFGHTHTPEIWHGAMSVGTSSKLKLEYNVGASSWMNTHALVYRDGTRQLVNIIEGRFTIRKK